jgi:hypothetical protein
LEGGADLGSPIPTACSPLNRIVTLCHSRKAIDLALSGWATSGVKFLRRRRDSPLHEHLHPPLGWTHPKDRDRRTAPDAGFLPNPGLPPTSPPPLFLFGARARRARRVRDVVFVRLEQISPFPHDLLVGPTRQHSGLLPVPGARRRRGDAFLCCLIWGVPCPHGVTCKQEMRTKLLSWCFLVLLSRLGLSPKPLKTPVWTPQPRPRPRCVSCGSTRTQSWCGARRSRAVSAAGWGEGLVM